MVRQIGSILIALLLTQNALALGEDESPTLNIRFATLPLSSDVGKETLYYTRDGEPDLNDAVALELNPRERSGYYSYQGPNPMPVFRKELGTEGFMVLTPVYQVYVPGVRGSWLVILEPANGQQQPLPLPSHCMEYDDSQFPEGSLLFFNSTAATFHGILGDKKIEITPGANRAIDISDYYEDEIPVGLVVKDGDKIHKVLVNKLRFYPERRTLMILRPPRREGSYRIQAQRITEYLGKFNEQDAGA
ncbi:hypothetical protein [Cerasicoccus maritimus]|uniref:hypothetical protein n=1 Tax=Cerasicoccus maritimus TaxID=490089 RepID=UPI002852C5D6|nr:hypothetical protein [Cerasicoccus maritimus]